MKRSPRILGHFLRAQPFLLPALVLIATWLPAANHGWPRTDSHRYAALALDAYRDSPFWAPTLGDMPYFNKPPLVFWIEGALLSRTGPQLWAIRLPTLLAALAALWLTVDLTRRLSGPRAATLTGLVLATTLEFFRYTHAISLDMWIALFAVALAWCAVRALRGKQAWLILGAIPIGAALMTKPFVIGVPIFLIAVWLCSLRHWRPLIPLAGATAIGIALALPWHLAMFHRFGHDFLDHYFIAETFERLDGRPESSNPWWYSIAALPQTYLPWIATLLLSFEAIIRRRFRPADRPAVRLALIWTGGWLLALTLFGDQRTRYMVPLYPLMAPLSGLWLARVLPARLRRSGRAAAPLIGPIAVVLAALANLLPPSVLDRIHEPRHPKWDAVIDYMRDHAVHTLWTTPDANSAAANLYLITGSYPKLLGPTPPTSESHAPTPAGAIILTHKSELPELEGMGQVVLSTSDIRLIRLSQPWPQPHQNESQP